MGGQSTTSATGLVTAVTTGSLPLGETRYSFSRTLKRALGTGSSGKELGEALAEELWRVEACPTSADGVIAQMTDMSGITDTTH